jgi:hypothetical protein
MAAEAPATALAIVRMAHARTTPVGIRGMAQRDANGRVLRAFAHRIYVVGDSTVGGLIVQTSIDMGRSWLSTRVDLHRVQAPGDIR